MKVIRVLSSYSNCHSHQPSCQNARLLEQIKVKEGWCCKRWHNTDKDCDKHILRPCQLRWNASGRWSDIGPSSSTPSVSKPYLHVCSFFAPKSLCIEDPPVSWGLVHTLHLQTRNMQCQHGYWARYGSCAACRGLKTHSRHSVGDRPYHHLARDLHQQHNMQVAPTRSTHIQVM